MVVVVVVRLLEQRQGNIACNKKKALQPCVSMAKAPPLQRVCVQGTAAAAAACLCAGRRRRRDAYYAQACVVLCVCVIAV